MGIPCNAPLAVPAEVALLPCENNSGVHKLKDIMMLESPAKMSGVEKRIPLSLRQMWSFIDIIKRKNNKFQLKFPHF